MNTKSYLIEEMVYALRDAVLTKNAQIFYSRDEDDAEDDNDMLTIIARQKDSDGKDIRLTADIDLYHHEAIYVSITLNPDDEDNQEHIDIELMRGCEGGDAFGDHTSFYVYAVLNEAVKRAK